MKKSFLKTFIVFGLFAILFFANSYTSVEANFSIGTFYYNSEKGIWENYKDNIWNMTVGTAGQYGAATQAGQAMGIVNEGQTAVGAALNPLTDTFTTALSGLITAGAWTIVQITSLALYISGGIFDMVIDNTIFNTSLFESLKQPISVSWKIVRDISNMVIVFSLLYLGIRTILDGQGFADKKTLAGVIMVAILINFSLLFTQTVFQISNFVSARIGEQIKFQGDSVGSNVSSISSGLTQMIKPQSVLTYLYDNGTGWNNVFNKLQVALFTVIIISVVTFILFASSLLIMYRFLAFIVLMVLSPIGLVSKFIPWFKNAGDTWWDTLKKQAIVLPAFFITLYISILFVSILTSGLSIPQPTIPFKAEASVIESIGTGLVKFVMNFIFVIGFLLLPLIVPGKIGAAGAGLMTSGGAWITNKVKSLPRRTAQRTAQVAASGSARAGRYLVGDKFANYLGGNTDEKKKALQLKARGSDLGAIIARERLRRSEGLKEKTYDVRNTGLVKNSNFGKGMGSAIDSYSGAVKKKMNEFEERKKKDMKAFGYDKLHESMASQVSINDAEKERDVRETAFKTAENAFKISSSDSDYKAMSLAKKELEEQQHLIGKLRNIGEFEFEKDYNNMFFRKINRMISNTSRVANQKIADEAKKRWTSSGESSKSRKLRATNIQLNNTLNPPTTS